MKFSAFSLLAVFLVSIVVTAFANAQQADALSAVNFTTKATVSSANRQFQQVYENGTNSVVFLDGSSGNGTYYKNTYNVAAGTVASATTTLSGSGNTVNGAAYASPVDLSRYSLHFDGATQYATASDNAVYDVSTESFWTGGFFKITALTGSDETILAKRSLTAGYVVSILSSDKFRFRMEDSVAPVLVIDSSATISTGVWYAWVVSVDKGGDIAHVFLYDTTTGILDRQDKAIGGVGNIANTATFTIGRLTSSPVEYFSGVLDDIIPPQTNQDLSQTQFLAFAQSGVLPTGINNLYDFNEGSTGATIKDVLGGSHNLTPAGGPFYSADVASVSQSRPTTYITGRDTATGKNGYAKINLSDLSKVADSYQASSYIPAGIAQSTTKLYSPLYNFSASAFGTLKLGTIGRDLTSYSEPTIYAGTAAAPAYSVPANITGTGATSAIGLAASGVGETVAAETFTPGAALVGTVINGIQMKLWKAGSPTALLTVGTFDSSGNVITTFGTMNASALTGTGAIYAFNLSTWYKISAGDRIGVKYGSGSGSAFIETSESNSDVYDGANAYNSIYNGGWSDMTTRDFLFSFKTASAKVAVIDGSPDTEYVFFESGTSSLGVVKYASSATTISTSLSHTVGQPYSIMQLANKILIQTANATYSLNTATDAITQIYNTSFNTRYPQTFTMSPAGRTFSATPVYIASSTIAHNWTPSTGVEASAPLIISQASNSTGGLDAYAPAKYYFLPQNDLTVEASDAAATTWTVKDPATRADVAITPYEENLGSGLLLSSSILSQDVIRLVCTTGIYNITISDHFSVGDDGDCRLWRVLDVSSAAIGRELPYIRTADLVHNPDYTNYNIHVTMSTGKATDYYARVVYDGKAVDNTQFDNGNNAQLRMLYGQCYTLQYVKILDGSIAQSSRVCADDVIFKESTLATDLGFTFWSAPWGASHVYDSATHVLTTILHHAQTPYNYTLTIFNATNAAIINGTYTDVNDHLDTRIFNLTAYAGQAPLKLQIFRDTGNIIYNQYVDTGGKWLVGLGDAFNTNGGTFAGWGLLMFLPVVFAAMFTRDTAGIGGGMLVAFIGVLVAFGVIALPAAAIWLITFVAVIGILAYRVLWQ